VTAGVVEVGVVESTHVTVSASQEQTLSGRGARVSSARRGWLGVVTDINAASTGVVLVAVIIRRKQVIARSTGTVHTSAKAPLTNAVIWRISISSRCMSEPLSVSPNSDESGKLSLYPDGDLDRHRN